MIVAKVQFSCDLLKIAATVQDLRFGGRARLLDFSICVRQYEQAYRMAVVKPRELPCNVMPDSTAIHTAIREAV